MRLKPKLGESVARQWERFGNLDLTVAHYMCSSLFYAIAVLSQFLLPTGYICSVLKLQGKILVWYRRCCCPCRDPERLQTVLNAAIGKRKRRASDHAGSTFASIFALSGTEGAEYICPPSQSSAISPIWEPVGTGSTWAGNTHFINNTGDSVQSILFSYGFIRTSRLMLLSSPQSRCSLITDDTFVTSGTIFDSCSIPTNRSFSAFATSIRKYAVTTRAVYHVGSNYILTVATRTDLRLESARDNPTSSPGRLRIPHVILNPPPLFGVRNDDISRAPLGILFSLSLSLTLIGGLSYLPMLLICKYVS